MPSHQVQEVTCHQDFKGNDEEYLSKFIAWQQYSAMYLQQTILLPTRTTATDMYSFLFHYSSEIWFNTMDTHQQEVFGSLNTNSDKHNYVSVLEKYIWDVFGVVHVVFKITEVIKTIKEEVANTTPPSTNTETSPPITTTETSPPSTTTVQVSRKGKDSCQFGWDIHDIMSPDVRNKMKKILGGIFVKLEKMKSKNGLKLTSSQMAGFRLRKDQDLFPLPWEGSGGEVQTLEEGVKNTTRSSASPFYGGRLSFIWSLDTDITICIIHGSHLYKGP